MLPNVISLHNNSKILTPFLACINCLSSRGRFRIKASNFGFTAAVFSTLADPFFTFALLLLLDIVVDDDAFKAGEEAFDVVGVALGTDDDGVLVMDVEHEELLETEDARETRLGEADRDVVLPELPILDSRAFLLA